jgi:ammonia channel protein AmtB
VFCKNLVAAIFTAAYAFIMSYLIFRGIGLCIDLHVDEDTKQVSHINTSFIIVSAFSSPAPVGS